MLWVQAASHFISVLQAPIRGEAYASHSSGSETEEDEEIDCFLDDEEEIDTSSNVNVDGCINPKVAACEPVTSLTCGAVAINSEGSPSTHSASNPSNDSARKPTTSDPTNDTTNDITNGTTSDATSDATSDPANDTTSDPTNDSTGDLTISPSNESTCKMAETSVKSPAKDSRETANTGTKWALEVILRQFTAPETLSDLYQCGYCTGFMKEALGEWRSWQELEFCLLGVTHVLGFVPAMLLGSNSLC